MLLCVLCVVLGTVTLCGSELLECPRAGVRCTDDPAVDPTAVCEGDHGVCCVYAKPREHSPRCLCRAGWAGVRCHIPVPVEDWYALGQAELYHSLKQQPNTRVSKNVILFIGDGMGMSTVSAARIYQGQQHGRAGEETILAFEEFPYTGLLKTYNVNHQVADSAGTASAMMTGEKVNYGTLGVNSYVMRYDCEAVAGNTLETIFQWAQDAGKRTGIVTTTRITHATPAAAYARTAERFWEADSDFLDYYGNDFREVVRKHNCTDIATQLVHELPGRDINVLLGGGRSKFMRNHTTDPEYPSKNGSRTDGRDLIQDWLTRHPQGQYVWNKQQFDIVDQDTEHLLGMFEPGHMHYDHERPEDEPSLEEMVEKAISILSKGEDGYLLLVEGGRIDHGHHAGMARTALDETVAFHRAVDKAVTHTDNTKTLIAVTADHSHVFTMGGYAGRGNDILGLLDTPDIEPSLDGKRRTTLAYADGPGAAHTVRADPALQDTSTFTYRQQAIVPTVEETHGGEDVAVYARGPMAHLLTGVHEQNYIAHVLGYAACIGPNTEHCQTTSGGRVASVASSVVIMLQLTFTWISW